LKRAANRKSASASRARKKTFVEEMSIENDRMRRNAQILALLPDLIVALCRRGTVSYVSGACEAFLQKRSEEMRGMSMFDLVTPECHGALSLLLR
ncbi:hypothetical protein JKP88DRAFT_154181, partial [Tribonema minus]